MDNQRTGQPYSGKYPNKSSDLANHHSPTRSARSVVLTYSLPTTTTDALDYHLIKGEAEEAVMPTTRMPTVAPVHATCTGET